MRAGVLGRAGLPRRRSQTRQLHGHPRAPRVPALQMYESMLLDPEPWMVLLQVHGVGKLPLAALPLQPPPPPYQKQPSTPSSTDWSFDDAAFLKAPPSRGGSANVAAPCLWEELLCLNTGSDGSLSSSLQCKSSEDANLLTNSQTHAGAHAPHGHSVFSGAGRTAASVPAASSGCGTPSTSRCTGRHVWPGRCGVRPGHNVKPAGPPATQHAPRRRTGPRQLLGVPCDQQLDASLAWIARRVYLLSKSRTDAPRGCCCARRDRSQKRQQQYVAVPPREARRRALWRSDQQVAALRAAVHGGAAALKPAAGAPLAAGARVVANRAGTCVAPLSVDFCADITRLRVGSTLSPIAVSPCPVIALDMRCTSPAHTTTSTHRRHLTEGVC